MGSVEGEEGDGMDEGDGSLTLTMAKLDSLDLGDAGMSVSVAGSMDKVDVGAAGQSIDDLDEEGAQYVNNRSAIFLDIPIWLICVLPLSSLLQSMDLALSSLSIILIKSNLFHKINNRYEIQHDQIVLQWSNGNTNGSPALEFVIEAAKVRDYTVEDMQGAAAAAHDALHGTYEDELERQREMNASLSGGSSLLKAPEAATTLRAPETDRSNNSEDSEKSDSDNDNGNDGGESEQVSLNCGGIIEGLLLYTAGGVLFYMERCIR